MEGPYVGNGDPSAETASVTFNLNGGRTVDGKEGSFVKEVPVGTWLRLPEAPRKDGASFAGWKCGDESITETRPGYSFKVTGDVSFEAMWK